VYDEQNWEEESAENWDGDGRRIRSDTQNIHIPIQQVTSIIPAARVLAVMPYCIIFDLGKSHPGCYLFGKVHCDRMFYYGGVIPQDMQEVVDIN